MLRKSELLFVFILLSAFISAQKVGLVLSGGGARGITHIGVIKALEENNIPIDYITGTSMGAIVGSLYAIGYTADDMIELLKSDDFKRWSTGDIDPKYSFFFRNSDPKPTIAELYFDLQHLDSLKFKPSFLPTNIVSPRQMNYAFVELFSRANALARGNFDNLLVPFRCVASDIYNKEAVVLKEGDLGDAVRASMTFPFMFKPIKIKNQLLFDGGIFNNFPVNVMRSDFKPDVMIGSVVSSNPPKPGENDIIKQIENMIVNRSDYSMNDDEGVLMKFNLENVSTFDFSKIDELVQVGYNEVIKRLPEIKARIKRQVTKEEMQLRRNDFINRLPELKFKNVYVIGVDSLQRQYIENTFHSGNREFDATVFKKSYFKLISDERISEVMPHALFNEKTNEFDLKLKVKTENRLKFSIGGNISSSTSNEAYFGLTFQNLKEYAQTAFVDAQFGRVYNGLGIGSRIDIPSQKDWYMKLNFVIHRFDYYEGNRMFYNDDRTSYFNQSEVYSKFSMGFPLTMNGKMEFGIGLARLTDNYRQDLLSTATGMDQSNYNLGSIFARFETYSLNNIMYPTRGFRSTGILQIAGGEELYKSSISPEDENTKSKALWAQFKFQSQKFFNISPHFTLGASAEIAYSSRPILNNYISTIIQAPAFRPTPHSNAIFNSAFVAAQYAAIGLKPIYFITDQLHFRTELYWFLPYQSYYKLADKTAGLSSPYQSSEYLIESTLVFDFKIASAGLFFNHYSDGVNRWNFGLNIGFLLFNKKFLE